MSEATLESVDEQAAERRASTVELLWDLVFVFAVTQVTALMADRPTWGRFGKAMLLLALVWWAWSAFVWAANAEAEDSRALRIYLLASTMLIFIVGLALPQAFGAEAVLFASAYALVRFLHLALYSDASRRGNASWSSIVGFAVTVVIGMVLLLVGAIFLDGWQRVLVWTVAAAIDYAGPAWLTRERLRGLQHVAVAHFADRYGTFVIICLGESIVAIGVGVGTTERRLTPELVIGAGLGLLTAVGMWWTYFDRFPERAQARLREHTDPVLAAADAYSYIHLIIVAGIIIFADGVKQVVHNSAQLPMPDPGRLAMCGGVAVYLIGLAAFRWRIAGERSPARVIVAAALMALFALGGSMPAWTVAGTIAALVVGLCVAEAVGQAPAEEGARTRAEAAGQARAEEVGQARAGEVAQARNED
jgi:low temperature requirement protein LtrA